MSAVKRPRKIHQTGPFNEDHTLRLPDWLEGAPPMPADWPVWHFWAMTGKAALNRTARQDMDKSCDS
jgi:hypothetical protein